MCLKKKVADMWRPIKGVTIKKAVEGLYLFQFAHKFDMEVWESLTIEKVKIGVQIENIPLFHIDF